MIDRRAARASVLREASERIYDPETIDARLSGMSGDQKDVLWRLYRASRSEMTARELAMRKELLGLYHDVAEDIQDDIGRLFSSIGSDKWDLQAARRAGRDRALFGQIEDRIKSLGGRVQQTFEGNLLGQYKKAYFDNAYRLDALTPESLTVKFGMLPDREIVAMLGEPWKGARFSDRIGLITDEMATNIKHSLVRSMMAEESWAAAARRIRTEMGTSGTRSVWRAEMVARTELAHAQELATAQFNKENEDVISEEVWVAHPGACEEICKPKHGLSVEEVGRPPDDSHPNCVCDVLAVPKSWGKLAKTGDGDFSIRPPSKKEWAADRGVEVV